MRPHKRYVLGSAKGHYVMTLALTMGDGLKEIVAL